MGALLGPRRGRASGASAWRGRRGRTRVATRLGLALAGLAAVAAIGAIPVATAGARLLQKPPQPYRLAATFDAGGATPHFPGLDELTGQLFVSHLALGTVTVLDAANGRLLKTIKVPTPGAVLHTVVVDQATQLVYVTDIANGLVDVISARSETVVGSINVGGHPHGLALSQSLHRLWVSNVGTSQIDVIDTTNNRLIAKVNVGPDPWGVAYDPANQTVWSANTGITPAGVPVAGGDTLTELSAITGNVIRTVVVGPHPWWADADPYNATIYAGVSAANEVAIVSADSGVVRGDIPVGASPHGMALLQRAHLLFVNDSASNQVSVIDTATNSLAETIAVGKMPQGVVADTRDGHVLVVDQGSAINVSVLEPGRSERVREPGARLAG